MSFGGAGGGYLEKYLTGLSPGGTLVLTVGAAGLGGAATPVLANGTNGGVTLLVSGTQAISTLSANGGAGSIVLTIGGSGGSPALPRAQGGVASGGDINFTGETTRNAQGTAGGKSPAGKNWGAQGAVGNSTSSVAGNDGFPGGCTIYWFK